MGRIRFKVEGHESSQLPDQNESNQKVQQWESLQRGEPSRTMSCSDKILKMNVLGLQGSLIQLFLTEPIYLSSIVLGSVFDPNHLCRAICCRLEKPRTGEWTTDLRALEVAPATGQLVNRQAWSPQDIRPFKLVHPALGFCKQYSVSRGVEKTDERAMNWYYSTRMVTRLRIEMQGALPPEDHFKSAVELTSATNGDVMVPAYATAHSLTYSLCHRTGLSYICMYYSE